MIVNTIHRIGAIIYLRFNIIPNGISDGHPDGITDGIPDGNPDGIPDGIIDGIPDGSPDGIMDGIPDGSADWFHINVGLMLILTDI